MSSILSKNIRFLREKKGLSQTALAQLIGANRGNIDTYERGIANPRNEIANNICNYFSISLDDLYNKDLSLTESAANEPETGYGQQAMTEAQALELQALLKVKKQEAERMKSMLLHSRMTEDQQMKYKGLVSYIPEQDILQEVLFDIDTLVARVQRLEMAK